VKIRLPLLVALVVSSLAPTPANAADETFDSNGVKIRYVTEGTGAAVVLVHGWMGDASMWGRDKTGNPKPKPPDGFQVIALDCRGHGKSDKPHDPRQYGPEMAADVVRLLDHLKIEKAHLIGYSMGVYVVSKVAATHPERVISVVYGGQAPLVTGLKLKAKSTGPSEVEIFAKLVDEGKDLSSYLMAVMPPDRPKLTEEQAKIAAKILYDGKDLKAYAAAGRSFGELRLSIEELSQCKAPILFIHGSKEVEETKERVAAIHKLLGRGEVKVIEGTDHVSTLAKPEFGTAIIEFLRANKTK
jgi:pimeloyl-ACP methyl ester carboxylesterase